MDGFEYYEFILCYIDDLLTISEDATRILQGVQATFKFKDNKIEKPDVYLGAQLDNMIVDRIEGWTMSSNKYVKAAVDNIEETLLKSNQCLPTKCRTPLTSGYQPEMDTLPELKQDGLQWYQEMIRILWWMVELGWVDVLLETALMSTHLAMPRWGHLEQLHHMFGYLKANPKWKLFFEPQHPNIDKRAFKEYDWYDFYTDAKERIPSDMLVPHGHSVSMHCFVDSNHAGDKVTQRSQTGILIFINQAPIMWHSKRQNMVEMSTFGSEFIAVKWQWNRLRPLDTSSICLGSLWRDLQIYSQTTRLCLRSLQSQILH